MSHAAAEDVPTGARHGLYKTELCKNFMTVGFCSYGPKCQFAHGDAELRRASRHPKFKTQRCKNYWAYAYAAAEAAARGVPIPPDVQGCPYGSRCHFLHDEPPGMSPGWGPDDDPRGFHAGMSPASQGHTFSYAPGAQSASTDRAAHAAGTYPQTPSARESVRSVGSTVTWTSDDATAAPFSPSGHASTANPASISIAPVASSHSFGASQHVGVSSKATAPAPLAAYPPGLPHATRQATTTTSRPAKQSAMAPPPILSPMVAPATHAAASRQPFGHHAGTDTAAYAHPISDSREPSVRSMATTYASESDRSGMSLYVTSTTGAYTPQAMVPPATASTADASGWGAVRQAKVVGSVVSQAGTPPGAHSTTPRHDAKASGFHSPVTPRSPTAPRSPSSAVGRPPGFFHDPLQSAPPDIPFAGSTRSLGSIDSASASLLGISGGALFSSSRSFELSGSMDVAGSDIFDPDARSYADDAGWADDAAARAALSVAAAAIDDTDLPGSVVRSRMDRDRGGSESDRSLVLSMVSEPGSDVWMDPPATSAVAHGLSRTGSGRHLLPQGISERQLSTSGSRNRAASAALPPAYATQPVPMPYASADAHATDPAAYFAPQFVMPPTAVRHADMRRSVHVQRQVRLPPGATAASAGRRTSIRQTLTQERRVQEPDPMPSPGGVFFQGMPSHVISSTSSAELPGGGVMQIQYTYHPPPNTVAGFMPGHSTPTPGAPYPEQTRRPEPVQPSHIGMDDDLLRSNTIYLPTPDGRGLMPVAVDDGPVFKAYSRGQKPAVGADAAHAATGWHLPGQPTGGHAVAGRQRASANRTSWLPSFGARSAAPPPEQPPIPPALPSPSSGAPTVRIVVVHHQAQQPPQPAPSSSLQSLIHSVSAGLGSRQRPAPPPPRSGNTSDPAAIPIPASLTSKGAPPRKSISRAAELRAGVASSPIVVAEEPSARGPGSRARLSMVIPSAAPTPVTSPTSELSDESTDSLGPLSASPLEVHNHTVRLMQSAVHSSSSSMSLSSRRLSVASSRLLEPVPETVAEEDVAADAGSSDDEASRARRALRDALTGIASSTDSEHEDNAERRRPTGSFSVVFIRPRHRAQVSLRGVFQSASAARV